MEDRVEVHAVEYQFHFFSHSATAALMPKVYLEQLSLLLLWLPNTDVFVLLPMPKESHLKSVCASVAFLIAIGESRCSDFFHPASLLLC